MVKLCKFHPLRSAAHDCLTCGVGLCKYCAKEVSPSKWACPEHEWMRDKEKTVIFK